MTRKEECQHLAFYNASKEGADKYFEYAKARLAELAGSHYEEIRRIANKLYSAGLEDQAKYFVELAYLHLRQKDMLGYTIIREQYERLPHLIVGHLIVGENKHND